MKKGLVPVLVSTVCLSAAAYLAVPASAADESTALTGWQSENGKRFYYDADGKKSVGEVTIDGVTYLFAPNGAQQIGWQTVNDKRFYYDKEGKAVFGWVDWRGERYYVSAKNGKLTGDAETDEGEKYHFDEYGVAAKWSQDADGNWCYAGAVGETEIDGVPYIFTEDGILKTGWQTAADGITRYYDPKSHEILTGWITDADEKSFYADPEKGKLTGWITDHTGTRYYIDAEKGKLTGWQVIGGKQYKLLNDGTVFTGFYPVNGVTYLFGDDGIMVTGWFTDTDGTRFFKDNGVMLVGLQDLDGGTYYFNAIGLMQTGDQNVTNADGTVTRMTFGEDGKLVAKPTGWQIVDGIKYYFNPDGTKATAPTVIEGKTYLFNSDGQLVTGLYTAADGSKYCGDQNGAAVTGWQEFPNQSSYFNADGKMAVSTKIEGYTIDANGSARNDRAIKADSYIANSDKTLEGIYKVYCSNHYYAYTEDARTIDQLMAARWDSLISPAIPKRGVCYHLAAGLDFVFKRAGYTSRVIYAWHGSHHYFVQVLINGFWWNYDPTYGMDRCHITLAQANQKDIARGGPGYTERGYVDAVYDHKGAMVSAKYTPVQ